MDVSSGKATKFSVQKVDSGQHRIISAENDLSMLDKVVYGRSELDSHDDNSVAGANCYILQYNGK